MIEFEPFPKLARLRRECIITEKIDGTNAAIVIGEGGAVGAQSRTRLITPADDNFGFARWVETHADRLRDLLGPGRHFGEWWGAGIQRRYNQTEKRLSLFNVVRWADIREQSDGLLDIVPTLYRGVFDHGDVESALGMLRREGSMAAPGFDKPEGIVVFHVAANTGFKVTLEKDDEPKSKGAA